jgi:hypothetical protein
MTRVVLPAWVAPAVTMFSPPTTDAEVSVYGGVARKPWSSRGRAYPAVSRRVSGRRSRVSSSMGVYTTMRASGMSATAVKWGSRR